MQLAHFPLALLAAFLLLVLANGAIRRIAPGSALRESELLSYRVAVLGLLAGYALSVTLSFAVDAIWFPGQGHRVHAW